MGFPLLLRGLAHPRAALAGRTPGQPTRGALLTARASAAGLVILESWGFGRPLPTGGPGDCGSSGPLPPDTVPIAALCPVLSMRPVGCFRYCGSSEADIANFDPRSGNDSATVGILFYFVTVGWGTSLPFPALTLDIARHEDQYAPVRGPRRTGRHRVTRG